MPCSSPYRCGAGRSSKSRSAWGCLIAAKYPPDRVDAAAAIVCEHPGISHCYLRSGQYNLWYTLAVPPDGRLDLKATAARLSELSHAKCHQVLESTRVYKIGVRLPLQGQATATPQHAADRHVGSPEEKLELTEQNKQLVRALQTDLPIEPEPFDRIASQAGLDAEQLLAAGQSYLSRGIIRRYAAVLRHRRVGFAVNCMTVWRPEDGKVDEAGAILAGFAEVTHCYRRPTWPGWPYSLYAMVHCRSEEEYRSLLVRMQEATGITDMLPLYSLAEYKKVRLRYFTPEFAQWEDRYAM